MFSLVSSASLAVRLYLMRRHEFDSEKLRRFFKEKYDIEVGLYSYGCFDRWRMPGPLRVGRYCSFARTVRYAPHNHPVTALGTHPVFFEKAFGVVDHDLPRAEPLVIEDDVWIGHYVMILPGCRRIGRGAVIGAGSVVTKDVDRYAVVAGNPARKIRDRFTSELMQAIEASRWWERDLLELRRLVGDRNDLLYRPTAEAIAAWLDAAPP